MAVRMEESKNIKFIAKGVLLDVLDGSGFIVEDEKSGEQETLLFDDIRTLIGKSVNISIINKEDVE